MSRIRFNHTILAGRELDYMRDAVDSRHIAGDGAFTLRCQRHLERALGSRKVLLTTSCTHALEMCALLLDIQPGDEIILPSFTFVSTANAFVLRGGRPVFTDIRRDTLNIDEGQIASLLSPRTRAIVVMHYGGVACAMDEILTLARDRGIPVIEDNAHGLFGRYRGQPLGSLGTASALSFHETKNITCGEGGALALNDASLIERAEIIREKGTDRSRFFRGEVDKYTWVTAGSSYLPSDILAAYLFAQLEVSATIQARRALLWQRYRVELATWAKAVGAALPFVPPECEPPFHLFQVVMPSLARRQALIAHLREHEVDAVFHYVPLHLSPMGRRFGGQPGDCPVTEDISDRLLRLPLSFGLSDADQTAVIAGVTSFR